MRGKKKLTIGAAICCLLLAAGLFAPALSSERFAAEDKLQTASGSGFADGSDIAAGNDETAAGSGETDADDAETAMGFAAAVVSSVSESAFGSGRPTDAGDLYGDLSTEDMETVSADEEGSSYLAGEVVLLFDRGVTCEQAQERMEVLGLSADSETLSASLDAGSLCRADVADGSSVAEILERIREEAPEEIAYAQPNYIYMTAEDTEADTNETDDGTEESDGVGEGSVLTAQESVDDPRASSQWHLDAIHAYDAWNTVKTEGTVAVALIDTGVDTDHEDLAERIAVGYNSVDYSDDYEDTYGHGTHVAGIVAAQTNNGTGVSGVSYNADLIPVKADQDNVFLTTYLCEAYTWLLADADGNSISDLVETENLHVINMSLSSLGSVSGDDALLTLIDCAYDQDILTVCAAGNNSTENVGSENTCYPGDYETCISVINLSKTLSRYTSSNYGDAKDISAPGTSILSTTYNGSYGSKTGTSMAAPVVSGIAALIFAGHSDYTADMVKEILEMSAQDLGDAGFDTETAWGCVDARAAVRANYGDNVITVSGGEHAKISDGENLTESYTQTVAFGDTPDDSFTVAADEGYSCIGFYSEDGTFYSSLENHRITSAEYFEAVCISRDSDTSQTTLVIRLSDAAKLQPAIYISGGTVTIDWGDGEVSTGKGTMTKPNAYESTGFYMIIISASDVYCLGNERIFSQSYQSALLYVYTGADACVNGAAFSGCENLIEADLSCCSVSLTESMDDMFYGCESLESLDLSGFGGSLVTSMDSVFYNCSSLESLDVSALDVSSVESMSCAFYGCEGLGKLDISGFDTSSVTDMSYLFYGCTGLEELDISGFDLSSATDLSYLFYGCTGLQTLNVARSDMSSAADLSYMFGGCINLKELNWSGGGTLSAISAQGMFYGCAGLEELDISGFDTSSAMDLSYLFYGCENLTELDLTGFDTSSAMDLSYLFYGCMGLEELDVSGFSTSSAADLSYLFYCCASLEELDVSGFDTSSATDLSYLFYGCENLTELDMTGFDTSSVTAMKNIFTGCYSLRKITVSDRFSFCGAGSTRLASFPYVQRLIYGSSGIWADIDTGDEYFYNEIPDYTAATYYAKADRTQRFTESDFSIAETMYYMGEAVEPDVDTYLLHGTEYTISCENNVECGTATVTVTGVGNFVGSGFQATFEIVEKPVQTVAYLLGDADGDGSVTVRDVTWMARSLAGVDIPYEFDSMTWDVDGDGELTVRDVTHLARYVSGVDEGLGIGEIYMVEK